MSVIRTIFWNSTQARLRTGWRFVVVVVLFFSVEIAGALAQAAALFGFGVTIVALLLAIGLIFLLFWLAARWIDRRPFADYGFHMGRGWWLDMGFGLALGALLMAIIFWVEQAAGWITVTGYFIPGDKGWGFGPEFIVAVVFFMMVGVIEELTFRSFFMKNLAETIPARWRGPQTSVVFAWLISSVIFGAAHLGNPNATPMAGFNIFIAGLLLGLPYLLTGDLAISVGLHITWNLFENNVFGFPVSGLGSTLSVIGISQGGPDLWTGGLFGPEAGLIAIPVMLLGAGLIVLWARWRKGSGAMAESLADLPAARPSSGYIADIEPSRD